MPGRLEQASLCGQALAVESARRFRKSRAKGVTARGTVDVSIATRCWVDGFRWLHATGTLTYLKGTLGCAWWIAQQRQRRTPLASAYICDLQIHGLEAEINFNAPAYVPAAGPWFRRYEHVHGPGTAPA